MSKWPPRYADLEYHIGRSNNSMKNPEKWKKSVIFEGFASLCGEWWMITSGMAYHHFRELKGHQCGRTGCHENAHRSQNLSFWTIIMTICKIRMWFSYSTSSLPVRLPPLTHKPLSHPLRYPITGDLWKACLEPIYLYTCAHFNLRFRRLPVAFEKIKNMMRVARVGGFIECPKISAI